MSINFKEVNRETIRTIQSYHFQLFVPNQQSEPFNKSLKIESIEIIVNEENGIKEIDYFVFRGEEYMNYSDFLEILYNHIEEQFRLKINDMRIDNAIMEYLKQNKIELVNQ